MIEKCGLLFLLGACVMGAQSSGLIASGYSHTAPMIPITGGQIVSLFVRGLDVPETNSGGFPLPTELAGVTVTLDGTQIPLFKVRPLGCLAGVGDLRFHQVCDTTLINVQIPTGLCAIGDQCLPYSRVKMVVYKDSAEIAAVEADLSSRQTTVHLLRCNETILNNPGACDFWISRADGSQLSEDNPANPGEEITIYATGLGRTVPTIPTGTPAPDRAPVRNQERYRVAFSQPYGGSPPIDGGDAVARPSYIGVTIGEVGIYQINVRVPESLALPPISKGSRVNLHHFTYGQSAGATDFTPLNPLVRDYVYVKAIEE